jgi:ribosomal protein S18 acetylase RimI-like enzyme
MEKGMKKIRLEVDMANSAAIALYSNRSFFATAEGINTVFMEKDL